MKKSILKYFKAFTLVGIMASFIAFTSCGSDDGGEPAATESVWELIENTDNLSLLEGELSVFTSLVATLDDPDADLTVFAPTDAALTVLLGTLGLEDFTTVNPDIAEAVLAYHVVATARIASGDVVEGETFTTAQGEVITVGAGGVLESGATSAASISNADIQATNGVVHLIDVVLVPPTIGAQIVATLGTVAQPVLLGADFTTLAAAITKADSDNVEGGDDEGEETLLSILSDRTLTGENQITVFAPTNATFAAADPAITVDTYDAATWESIIKHHIVQGQGDDTDDNTLTLDPEDLVTCAEFTTLLGLQLEIFNNTEVVEADNGLGIYIDSNGDVDCTLSDMGASLTNLDAEVVLPDADGGSANGRVHVIAGVLAPPTPQ
ncbi:fasciclin domain-containing protein [Ekhidna sp.]|uniref:fasciclin domain-containing protein n=1 Tax=Ekhidna sp. TaxID=2608089 RepID=UPI0032EADFA2